MEVKVGMKIGLNALRLAVAIVCLLALIAVVAFAQGDGGGRTWDDAVTLFHQAVAGR
jgi:hypothetical protein